MKMRNITYTVYTIDEHPDKEKCYEWMRNNLHHLADYEEYELIASLKALRNRIGGDLKYAVCLVPDRGEHISFTDYDEELLAELDADTCPLTGCFWDAEVIEHLRADDMRGLLDKLHKSHDFHYTDDALYETAEAHEWEFKENGVRQ
tara:strand:+ start:941 stop:1381 length:441 start_codon:yes stop_codon:yes gene_type:complete